MYTATVENGEQVDEFQNGDITKGHGKCVIRQQADTVKPDLLSTQVVVHDGMRNQLLMEFG